MNLCQLINSGEATNALVEFYEGEYAPENKIEFYTRDDCKDYMTRKVTYMNLTVDREFYHDGHSTLIAVLSENETEGEDSIFTHPFVKDFLSTLDNDAEFKILNYLTKNALVLNFAISNELSEERPLLVIEPAETIVAYVNPFMQN